MRYLTKVVETYRLANEKEVEIFLNELKSDHRFTVAKYSSTKKEKKSKGEIIDEWIKFEVTKIFNDEQEPNNIINIDYYTDERKFADESDTNIEGEF
jgi:hypothetical protein